MFASAKAMPYATTAANIMSMVATKPERTARASQPCRNVVCAFNMVATSYRGEAPRTRRQNRRHYAHRAGVPAHQLVTVYSTSRLWLPWGSSAKKNISCNFIVRGDCKIVNHFK